MVAQRVLGEDLGMFCLWDSHSLVVSTITTLTDLVIVVTAQRVNDSVQDCDMADRTAMSQ